MESLEHTTAGITVIEISGRLDATSAQTLLTRLFALIDSGGHRLVMDLSRLDYTDSVGLRAFLMTAKRLAPVGGRMVMCGVQPAVRQLFETAGFDKIFTIGDTREDARLAIDS